jgi:DNA sulfur modification protein DndD
MRFKSIELSNFRQFANHVRIDFSEDQERNITVIIGNNGAGKTTLLQAFRWCLYGEANLDFSEVLYNKNVFDNAENQQLIEVKVVIEIDKDGDLYRLTRIQNYIKTGKERHSTKTSNPSAAIKKKNVGNYTTCNVLDVYKIIPKDLSTYFLFDGERMRHLSENTSIGKKDIKTAVTSILGIDILHNSIADIKNVIRTFKDQKQADDSEKMNKLNRMIKERIEIIEKKYQENDEYRKQHTENTNKIEMIDEYLLTSKLVEEKVKQRKFLEGEIRSQTARSANLLSTFYQYYSENGFSFLIKDKLKQGLELIEKMKVDDKAIIGIDSKAINQILARGFCICGNKVENDSNEKEHLVHLLDFVPPKSLSSLLTTFKDNIDRFSEDAIDFKLKLSNHYIEYQECLNKINVFEQELSDLNEEIQNVDIDIIANNQKTRVNLKNANSVLSTKIGENNKMMNDAKKELEKLEKNRESISINNEHNKKIDKKVMLCDQVLSRFEKEILTYESSIRENLKIKVSELSERLFTSKRTISIDSNYDFRFKTNSGLEVLGEGEKIVASFATVSAIIEIAKMNNIILRAEKYPLVMDAPFAKLDKTHRKNVAQFIPQIAEQIILFTVDSQWNGTVEEAMTPYIGKEYLIVKNQDGISTVEAKR